MGINLKSMSRAELLDLRSDIEKALIDAEKRDRDSARAAAEKAVAEFGFSLSEVTEGGKRGRKAGGPGAAPKYRNPDDHSQTWSGRGRKPNWLNAALASGTSIDDLEI